MSNEPSWRNRYLRLSEILGCEESKNYITFQIPLRTKIDKLSYNDLLDRDAGIFVRYYMDNSHISESNSMCDMMPWQCMIIQYILTIPRDKTNDIELNRLFNRPMSYYTYNSPVRYSTYSLHAYYVYYNNIYRSKSTNECCLCTILEYNSIVLFFCSTGHIFEEGHFINRKDIFVTSFISISMETLLINILNLFISDDHWLLYGILIKRFHININRCRELRIHEMNSILHQDMFEIMLEYTKLRMFYNRYKKRRSRYIADELEYIEITNEWNVYIQYTNTVNSILSLMHLKY